jgi:hypothetical protein
VAHPTKQSYERGNKMLKIGDKVQTRAINGEMFYGQVIQLDRFGFAYVSFNGMSETRISLAQLMIGE